MQSKRRLAAAALTSGTGAYPQAPIHKERAQSRRTRRLTAAGGLVALALVGSLPAATTPAKTQVTITMRGTISGVGGPTSGTFDLVGASTAYSDSGRLTFTAPLTPVARKTPEGLNYSPIQLTETLRGKKGTLVIRSSVRLFEVVKLDDFVATGTWSILRGTGKYAGLTGRGTLIGITQAPSQAQSISDYDYSYRLAGLVGTA
jgi:hypothetical protein